MAGREAQRTGQTCLRSSLRWVAHELCFPAEKWKEINEVYEGEWLDDKRHGDGKRVLSLCLCVLLKLIAGRHVRQRGLL